MDLTQDMCMYLPSSFFFPRVVKGQAYFGDATRDGATPVTRIALEPERSALYSSVRDILAGVSPNVHWVRIDTERCFI